MEFYVYRTPDQKESDQGVHCTFVDPEGRKSSSFFSSPPDSIDHVDQGYLKDRFTNVQTEKQANFIKERFTIELQNLKTSNSSENIKEEKLEIYNKYFRAIHDLAEKWSESIDHEEVAQEIIQVNTAYLMQFAMLNKEG